MRLTPLSLLFQPALYVPSPQQTRYSQQAGRNMASYARLSTDESGRLQPEASSSRKHLPLFAFVAGLLLTVVYYESPGLGLAMPASSPTSSSSSSLASSADTKSDYGSFVVAGEQSPEAAAQELSAARAALTSAQRLADDRKLVSARDLNFSMDSHCSTKCATL